ncbi:hypothetical protein VTI74DRAFT_127 [Chaetomium olivicolor]
MPSTKNKKTKRLAAVVATYAYESGKSSAGAVEEEGNLLLNDETDFSSLSNRLEVDPGLYSDVSLGDKPNTTTNSGRKPKKKKKKKKTPTTSSSREEEEEEEEEEEKDDIAIYVVPYYSCLRVAIVG